MGKKQKPVASAAPTEPGKVVVSRTEGVDPLAKVPLLSKLNGGRRRLAVLVVVALLVVLAIVLWTLLNHSSSSISTPLPANIDTDYAGTNVQNYPVLLKHDYNLSVPDIEKGNLSKLLKTFNEATNVATALNRLGHPDRALEAYKVANGMNDPGKGEDFYADFMGLAYEQGDAKLGAQMYQKAVDAVKSSSLSATDKKDEYYRLQLMLKNAQAGNNK